MHVNCFLCTFVNYHLTYFKFVNNDRSDFSAHKNHEIIGFSVR